MISNLLSRHRLSGDRKMKKIWEEGIGSEIQFWDNYFRYDGLMWPDDYKRRFDPELPLQERPAALISGDNNRILDVGAGPLTYLGKKLGGKCLDIIAIDPLADDYRIILDKYKINPIIITDKLAAEDLSEMFDPDSFDLVFARNCIDHSYNPKKAILEMINVVKRGKYVLLEHKPNEAENENYHGLHQWNFSMNPKADFIVSSKFNKVNITRKYSKLCTTTCEIILEEGEGNLLITRILKK